MRVGINAEAWMSREGSAGKRLGCLGCFHPKEYPINFPKEIRRFPLVQKGAFIQKKNHTDVWVWMYIYII